MEKCFLCEKRGPKRDFICCSDCGEAFHKVCLDPLRVDWSDMDGVEVLCDICGAYCQVCEEDKDDDQLVLCDYCNRGYHAYCLVPPLSKEEIEAEDDWFCPDCQEEIEEDEEWAREHVVPDEEMTAEDQFTRSTCECRICREMNDAADGWSTFQPRNGIERALKAAIDSREPALLVALDDEAFLQGRAFPS